MLIKRSGFESILHGLKNGTYSGLAHSIIQLAVIISWMMLMTFTNSYYVIYLLIGVTGLYCRHQVTQLSKAVFLKENRLNLIIASVFSLLLIAANYDMFYRMTGSLYHSLSKHNQFGARFSEAQFVGYRYYLFVICLPVLFLGGLYLTFFILQYITKKANAFSWKQNECTYSSRKVFLHTLLIISGFYTAILLLCFYPGFFCPDTVNQLKEIFSGSYSNRNPLYHTMLVRLFVAIGTHLFHDITIGAALYSIITVFFLSSSFAYAAVTLYQLKTDRRIVYLAAVFYMLMPHNILFSFNMWKDTPFNACVLLFTVSIFRYLKEIGKKKENAAVGLISSLGMCLFRGNGLIVIFVFLVFFAVLFRKTEKKMIISLAATLALALIMTFPMLKLMNVSQTDIVEMSSVPIQQIARTIIENDDLSDEETALLSKIADLEKVKSVYDPTLSDPMKWHLYSRHSEVYIQNHKSQFLMLYIRLGLRHPKSYLTAWIDQTRGYWNGGYDTVKFSYAFMPNDFGIKNTILLDKAEKAVFLYCTLYEVIDLLRPFVSIGLHTWLILLVAFVGYRRRDKVIMLTTVPCIAIVFSLLLGTPVFAEFRYAYGLFCCLPFLAVAVFGAKTNTDSADNVRLSDSD